MRTIANPDPGDLYRFGYSVDVFQDWIVVGAVGWGDRNTGDTTVPGYSDRSGRAYFYEASTGNLLFKFDGTFTTGNPESENHDQFGESVSIDGNYVVVGAPHIGPFQPGVKSPPDEDAGHAYIFSTVTGALLHVLENPEPEAADPGSGEFDLDFGITVATSNGKVVVGNPDTEEYTVSSGTHIIGKSYFYEASTGLLLHTLLAPDIAGMGEGAIGRKVAVDGNVIAVAGGSTSIGALTYVFDAATGSLTQTHEDLLLSDVHDDHLASRVFTSSAGLTTFGSLLEADSGTVISTIPLPPGYVSETWTFVSTITLFGNQLLVGEGVLDTGIVCDVFVYDTCTNAPPTDIALSGNSIAENSTNGTVVGGLTATDPTSGETLTFSMVVSAGGRFGINGTDLVVADGLLLNFEANTSHSVTVRVTDSAGNTYEEAFTINVTDVNEAATLISLTPNSESENTTNGAVVSVLSSNDPDSSDPETFELLDDAGGRFEQVGLQIRVANASLLDFETASSHQINVRVTDSVGHVLEQLVTINIADFNYTPTDITLSGNTVREAAVNVHFRPLQTPQDNIGDDIAMSGDRFIVSRNVTSLSGQAPQVFVHSRTTGGLTAILTSPSIQNGQTFAQQVAIDGDLAVVSTTFGNGSRAVYVYDVTTGGLLRTLTSPLIGNTAFGKSVAVSGNLIAVGGGPGPGDRVYLFDAGNGVLLETLSSPNPAGGSSFGRYVGISGNSVVVGQASAQVNGITTGAAYVYQYDSGTTVATLVTTLNNPSPDASDGFGVRVEQSGDLVAVSAPFDDTQAADSGLVHVFNATTGALLHSISNPSPGNGDRFGGDMAISGNRLIVSATDDDTAASNAGAAFLFDRVRFRFA